VSLLKRQIALKTLSDHLKVNPCVAILGPRQCGKTTLSKQFAEDNPNKQFHFFDLENPQDLASLDAPMLSLQNLQGYIVIDEVQRRPELFPVLRVLIDEWRQNNKDNKLIILGSASRDLLQQSSETLAGRIGYMELTGFSLNLLSLQDSQTLWNRGGFPLSFLAESDEISVAWRQNFIRTFLERDIPSFGFKIPSRTIHQFWSMLAHYHAQVFNAAEIARSVDSSATSVKRYLDLLASTFMIRVLQPYCSNSKKRIVKSPKVYFRDSGILHSLLGINSFEDLRKNPKLGASWEGFVLEEIIQAKNLRSKDCYFWSLHSGAEMDLVYKEQGSLKGIEIKYSDAPKMTKSIVNALEELELDHVEVIYPGEKEYKIHEKVTVKPLTSFVT